MRPTARLTIALALGLAVTLAWATGGRHEEGTPAAAFAMLPGSPPPALLIGRPRGLPSARFVSRWASLRAPAVARERPAAAATPIVQLDLHAPEGTPNALQVLRSRAVADGSVWVEVRLPTLPNGRLGWIPRHALRGYETVDTHLVVDRRSLRATLYRAGREVFHAPVGVGAAGTPTPAGEFLVRSVLTRYASPFYGPIAFGTTARSAVLTDWPAGGFIGIHGTNAPQLIPGRVSHGCIRLRNDDIRRLARLMPVGTPLTIR